MRSEQISCERRSSYIDKGRTYFEYFSLILFTILASQEDACLTAVIIISIQCYLSIKITPSLRLELSSSWANHESPCTRPDVFSWVCLGRKGRRELLNISHGCFFSILTAVSSSWATLAPSYTSL